MNSNPNSIQNNLSLDENPNEIDLTKTKEISDCPSEFNNDGNDSDLEFQDVDQEISDLLLNENSDQISYEMSNEILKDCETREENEEADDEFYDFDEIKDSNSFNSPCTSANSNVSTLANGLEKLLLKQKM